MSKIAGDSSWNKIVVPVLTEGKEGELRHYQKGSCKQSITQEERAIFNKIFKKLANDSLPSLLWNRSSIEKLHKRVSHVHPFNFVELVHADPLLKENLIKICKSNGFVKEQCMADLKEGLKVQHAFDNLLPFTHQFAEKMNLDGRKVYSLIEKKEFSELIDKLENYLKTCVFG